MHRYRSTISGGRYVPQQHSQVVGVDPYSPRDGPPVEDMVGGSAGEGGVWTEPVVLSSGPGVSSAPGVGSSGSGVVLAGSRSRVAGSWGRDGLLAVRQLERLAAGRFGVAGGGGDARQLNQRGVGADLRLQAASLTLDALKPLQVVVFVVDVACGLLASSMAVNI